MTIRDLARRARADPRCLAATKIERPRPPSAALRQRAPAESAARQLGHRRRAPGPPSISPIERCSLALIDNGAAVARASNRFAITVAGLSVLGIALGTTVGLLIRAL